MTLLSKIRETRGISQRNLAKLAGIPFRTLQLLEWGGHDPRLSTIQKMVTALGYSPQAVEAAIDAVLSVPPESIAAISERIVEEGESSWKSWLFNFVDAFRSKPSKELIALPPVASTTPRIKALLAATVEALCETLPPFEKGGQGGFCIPDWCDTAPPLAEPWFVAEMESLKATAVVESPVHFRKRNIFVLENFLRRA